MTPALYHLALAGDWAGAGEDGYSVSTVGRSLAEEGFVHCSFARQVERTADRFYRGRADVVLLVIDPDRLTAPVKVEDGGGGGESFPHVYGPINRDAVLWAVPVPLREDGRLDVRGLVDLR